METKRRSWGQGASEYLAVLRLTPRLPSVLASTLQFAPASDEGKRPRRNIVGSYTCFESLACNRQSRKPQPSS